MCFGTFREPISYRCPLIKAFSHDRSCSHDLSCARKLKFAKHPFSYMRTKCLILFFAAFFAAEGLHAQSFTNVRISDPSLTDPEEVTIAINQKNTNQLAAGSNLDYFFFLERWRDNMELDSPDLSIWLLGRPQCNVRRFRHSLLRTSIRYLGPTAIFVESRRSTFVRCRHELRFRRANWA